jgi:hypothetical protein
LSIGDGGFYRAPGERTARAALYGLALGYEDLTDHRELRRDPLLAVAAEKHDPLGEQRLCADDRGFALAAPCTLNRLELSAQFWITIARCIPTRRRWGRRCWKWGCVVCPGTPRCWCSDFDASDDPLHGHQEGRFFHGYYDQYCYLPLFCFCGDVVLWAQLRTADREASDGTVEALAQIVAASARGSLK